MSVARRCEGRTRPLVLLPEVSGHPFRVMSGRWRRLDSITISGSGSRLYRDHEMPGARTPTATDNGIRFDRRNLGIRWRRECRGSHPGQSNHVGVHGPGSRGNPSRRMGIVPRNGKMMRALCILILSLPTVVYGQECLPELVEWHGECLDPTGQVSATEAIDRVLNSLSPPVVYGRQQAPTRLDFPPGFFLLNDPDGDGIAITFPIPIIADMRGTVFQTTPDVQVGLYLPTRVTDRTQIQGGQFVGPSRAGASIGIKVRSHGFMLWGTQVINFGTCIDLSGFYSEDEANTIGFKLFGPTLRSCGVGLLTRGNNGSAGHVFGAEVLGVDVGVDEGSAFGNNYFGVSVEGSTVASWRMDQSRVNSSLLAGLLIESGEVGHGRSSFGGQGLVVGGNVPGRMSFEDTAERVGHSSSRLVFRDRGPSVDGANGPWGSHIRMPGFTRFNEVMRWYDPPNDYGPFALRGWGRGTYYWHPDTLYDEGRLPWCSP